MPTPPHPRPRDQRGSVTVQMVVVLPALFSVMFLGVQGALYFHARAVALAAAQEGAREAGSHTGTQASGLATARAFLDQAGGSDVMTAAAVSASRTPTTATITVTGTSLSVIPGWHIEVRQSASAPVERLT